MVVRNLIVRIGADVSGLGAGTAAARKELKKTAGEFDDSLKSVGKTLSQIGKVATTGILAATAGIGAFAAKGISLASDLQEVQNVVDTTFGASAKTINDWAKSAAGSFGMGELQAKKFNGTMGAMLKSMGLGEKDVLKMSTSISGLSGDFASFYNLDAEDAFAKIRSGISGETEPLKQLGINMSVANLEAYAMSQGLNKAYKEMTQAEQATLRYNYLLSVSKDAQGDFAKTSGSFANQQRILKLKLDDLAATIGKNLLPAITDAMPKITEAFSKIDPSIFKQLGESVANALPKLIEFVVNVIPKIIDGFKWIFNNGATITSLLSGIAAGFLAFKVASVISAAVNTIKAFQAVTQGATVAQALFNMVMAANPIVLIVTLVAALVAALIVLWNTNEGFRKAVIGVWDGIKNAVKGGIDFIVGLFNTVVNWVKKNWQSIALFIINPFAGIFKYFYDNFAGFRNFINGIGGAIKGFFVGIWNSIKGLWNSIVNIFAPIVAWFGQLFTALLTIAINILTPIINFFASIWNGIVSIFSAVASWFGDLFISAYELIASGFSAVLTFFTGIYSGIVGILSPIAKWFGDIFTSAWNGITAAFGAVGNFFKGIFDTVVGIFAKIGTAVGNAISDAFKLVVNGVLSVIEGAINTIIKGINTVTGFLTKISGVKIGEVPKLNIPKLAKGGLAYAPTLAMVGDNKNAGSDPEVIAPLSKLKDMFPKSNVSLTIPIYVDGKLSRTEKISLNDIGNANFDLSNALGVL